MRPCTRCFSSAVSCLSVNRITGSRWVTGRLRQAIKDFEAIHLWHQQIKNNQVRLLRPGDLDTGLAAIGPEDAKPFRLQDRGQQLDGFGVISIARIFTGVVRACGPG